MTIRTCVCAMLLAAAWLGCAAPPVESSIVGNWSISDYVAPGPAAITRGEADERRGAQASFSARRASVMGNVCDTPAYEAWMLSPLHFRSDYGVPPSTLGIVGDSVRVVKVACKGEWRVPGTELIVVSRDRLVFMADGIFFLLTRPPT